MKIKICSTCKTTKGLSEFNKNCHSLDGHYSICRECTKKKANLRYQHKDKFQYTKRMYGIDKEGILSLLHNQNNKCLLCDTEFEVYSRDTKRQFTVDHCHVTGRVRGLLCHHCNIGLGMFKDNEETMLKAIAYIKKKV